MSSDARIWCITLASGTEPGGLPLDDGTDEICAPVQFCSLPDGETPVAAAVARARRLRHVAGHLLFLRPAQRPFWQWGPEADGGPTIFLEDHDRGSGTTALTALAYVVQADPDATIVMQPTHLAVADDTVLQASILAAARLVSSGDNRLLALSLGEDQPPGPPPKDRGAARSGARRSTVGASATDAASTRPGRRPSGFVVGQASAFVRAFDRIEHRLVHLLLTVARARPHDLAAAAEALYSKTAPLDLMGDVLAPAGSLVRVMAVPPCGAVDLRSAAAVSAFLRRSSAPVSRPRRRLPTSQTPGGVPSEEDAPDSAYQEVVS